MNYFTVAVARCQNPLNQLCGLQDTPPSSLSLQVVGPNNGVLIRAEPDSSPWIWAASIWHLLEMQKDKKKQLSQTEWCFPTHGNLLWFTNSFDFLLYNPSHIKPRQKGGPRGHSKSLHATMTWISVRKKPEFVWTWTVILFSCNEWTISFLSFWKKIKGNAWSSCACHAAWEFQEEALPEFLPSYHLSALCSLCIHAASGLDMSLQNYLYYGIEGVKLMKCLLTASVPL